MENKNRKRKSRLQVALFFLLEIVFLLMSFSLRWATENYGNIGLDEIIFQLSMPLAGTATHIFISYALGHGWITRAQVQEDNEMATERSNN